MRGAEKQDDRSFGKSVRLKGRSDFLETIRGRESRKFQGNYCMISFAGSLEGSVKFGVSVSRKAGDAVTRNRLKRIIKEFLRNNRPLWPRGGRVVISLSSPVNDETGLTGEIGEILSGIDE